MHGIEKVECDRGERLRDGDATVDVCPTMTRRSLERGPPPLDLATIEDVLGFHITVSRGRIDEEVRITAD